MIRHDDDWVFRRPSAEIVQNPLLLFEVFENLGKPREWEEGSMRRDDESESDNKSLCQTDRSDICACCCGMRRPVEWNRVL